MSNCLITMIQRGPNLSLTNSIIIIIQGRSNLPLTNSIKIKENNNGRLTVYRHKVNKSS